MLIALPLPLLLSLSTCSHENVSGYYRVSVFFLAKVLIDLILMRILPLCIYTVIAYFMVGKLNTKLKKNNSWDFWEHFRTPAYSLKPLHFPDSFFFYLVWW